VEAREVSETPRSSKGAALRHNRRVTTPRARSVAPLLLASGACALMFEVVWIRGLTLWFGRTMPAVTTVLAAFLAGLAIGGLVFGKVADRARRPLALYGALEVGIGVVGLAVSVLLIHGSMLVPVAKALGALGALEGPVRFAIFFALLVVPAAMMGGTVPVVARALARSGSSGRSLGIVYAANTTGAVLGALVPDLVTIPRVGMTTTASLAALGDLLVGLWVLARWGNREWEPIALPRATVGPSPALALFAVTGFTAMGLEIVWSRMLEHVTGAASSFSILLAAYLAALATGTWLAAPFADRTDRPLRWAAVAAASAGLLAIVPFFVLQPALAALVSIVPHDPRFVRQPLITALQQSVGVSAILAAGPCVAMGATFPFLGAFVVRSQGPGAATGQLLAVNTLAGVLGSFATGFALVPALGTQSTAFVLGLAVLAASATILVRMRDVFAVAVLGALGVSAVQIARTPRDQTVTLLFGDAENLETVVEGAVTSVAVARREENGTILFKALRTPGVAMSNTAFGARRYMGMMAHVPVLLAGEATDVLLVCFGVGNTARSLLAHPGIERLDVVDVSPEVLALSPRFAEVTGSDPLLDPRVAVHIDDGRHHLLTTDRRYDVITAEPPPPMNAGVVNLYTREYYEAARRALKPGGMVVQWLPAVTLTDAEDRAIIGAFIDVFPHASLFYGYQYQWFLVGSDEPLQIDPVAWSKAVSVPAVRADLESIGVDGVGDLVAAFLADRPTLRAVAGDRTLTDDRPSLQYPWDSVSKPAPVPEGLPGSPFAVGGLVADPRTLEPYARALRAAAALYPQLAWAHHPAREIRHLVLGSALWPWLDGEDAGRQARLELLELDDGRVRAAHAWLLDHPTDPAARFVLGARAYYDRDFGKAWFLLLGAEQLPDLAPSTYLLRAGAARMIGQLDDARADLERARTATSTPAFAAAVERIAEHLGEPPGEQGPHGPPG
jgi:spermidine synthase